MKIRTFMKASIVALLLSGVVVSGYAALIVIDDANAGRVGYLVDDPEEVGLQVDLNRPLEAGVYRNGFQAHPVFVFQMTGVANPSIITEANFSVSLLSNTGPIDFDADAHVIRKAASSDILVGDYEASAQLLMSGFNIPSDTAGAGNNYGLSTDGQATLGTWLKNNWADGEYVFIGLKTNPLTPATDADNIKFYRYSLVGGNYGAEWSEGKTDAQLTVIPEPATLGLIAFFCGAVLFIRRRFTT